MFAFPAFLLRNIRYGPDVNYFAKPEQQSQSGDERAHTSPLNEVDPRYKAIEEQDEEEGAIVLDPKNSERKYYRDPISGLQREIWRPGSCLSFKHGPTTLPVH